ncbi:hypothetical protein BC826DRAFT_1032862 [Russula brevipes]|nr:hypothetical protein BC826DRAFT_1032862 [Russula brevipes]
MFFLTTVLLCVLALAQAVLMNPVRLVISPHITSPTESTVWHPSDQVTVTWDTSMIPAEGNFPGMLVLGHPEGDSENLDVDHPLAQDFSLRAGSVGFTVPGVKPMSNYIVVLFGDSGNASPQFASPQFTIENPSTLVKRAPQETPAPDPLPSPDFPDPDPTEPDPTGPDPGTGSQPPATSPGAPATSTPATGPAPTTAPVPTTGPARTTPSTAPPAAVTTSTSTGTPRNTTSPSSTTSRSTNTSSRSSPTSSGGANGALSFAQHAHHTGTIALCAAVAAMSLMFVM